MERDLNNGDPLEFAARVSGLGDVRLGELVQQKRASLSGTSQGVRVLLIEREVASYLAGFIAAVSNTTPVRLFLGTPRWSAAERESVMRLVAPEIVWGGERPESSASAGFESGVALKSFVMIPTGGTSGELRFAVHSTQTLASAARGLREWLGGGPVHSVCCLPLDHVSGMMQIVRAWISGGNLAMAAWSDIEAGRLTPLPGEGAVLSLVPTQLARLLGSAAAVAWLRGFRAVFLGGAAPWPSLLEAARATRVPVAMCYGMTETAAQVAAQRPEDFLAGAAPRVTALPHARIESVGTDGSSALIAGEAGRIRVNADSLFLGYWPDTTRGRDAFLTGDRGVLDEAGRLTVLGRADAFINTGGEKVDPLEVEEAIRATTLVRDVAVCGVPDLEWGEAVVAVVAGADVAIEAILRERLRGSLAPHKIPKRFVRCLALPRTEAGKIDRRALTVLAEGGNL